MWRMRSACCLLWIAVSALSADEGGLASILVANRGWELLGQGYQLTADCAAAKAGEVYFTDASHSRIHKIDADGRITVFKEGSDRAHGVALGPDGRLYAGQHDLKRIVAFAPDGSLSVIGEGMQTHHLTVSARGQVYFSDPVHRRIWRIDGSGKQQVVSTELNWPHAMQISPNGSELAVTDTHIRWVWKFPILPDGSLSKGRPFYHLQVPEGASETDAAGLAFDSQGYLYVGTSLGVQVFDPEGRLTGIIAAPGKDDVNNVFFAGPKRKWLYVTDGERIFRRPVKRTGS